ncbi:MAG: DUF2164 family protein [Candidatus Moraniibacteriota bacterium]
MVEVKRDWDVLSDAERRLAVDEIIAYFTTERNEKIGVVAVGSILDFFLQVVGNSVYNRALDDLKPLLEKNFGDTLLDVDISLRKVDQRGIASKH